VKLIVAMVLLGFAGDAFAWGLQTHIFYAQYVLLAVPFADPDFRRAAARLPRLVLAGACLPDLSLAGRVLGTPAFRRAHQWATLRRFSAACCDEERAVAIGYASHLAADVIAHHRFVPEHERRIADIPHVTHALCEWAMDEHVKHSVGAEPGDVLVELAPTLAARGFRCSEALAGKAIGLLARGERFLRASPLPRLSRRALGFSIAGSRRASRPISTRRLRFCEASASCSRAPIRSARRSRRAMRWRTRRPR
jgi:hypothetical protein